MRSTELRACVRILLVLAWTGSIVISLTSTPVRAQEWFRKNPAVSPPARQQHAMAYDPIRRQVVMFGGWGPGSVYLNDTWTWDGTNWTQHIVPLPPEGRFDHRMVFDAGRGFVVMYGGIGANGVLSETWAWNGTDWGQILTPNRPVFLLPGYGLAYDSSRNRTIAFGQGSVSRVSETWELNPTDWIRRQPVQQPSGGPFGSLTTDPASGRPFFQLGPSATVTLWEYDGSTSGNTWNVVGSTPTSFSSLSPAPSARLLGFDVQFGQLRVFERGQAGTWTQRMTATTPTNHGPMAFDFHRGLIVLFAEGFFGRNTWEYDNDARQATVRLYGTGCGSPTLAIAASPGARPLSGSAFTSQVTGIPAGAAVAAIGVSPLQVGLGFYGLPGCVLLQDLAVPSVPLQMTSPTAAQLTIPIPNQRIFIGASFFLQALAPAPGVNAAGAITSNGLDCLIGNY